MTVTPLLLRVAMRLSDVRWALATLTHELHELSELLTGAPYK